MANIKRNILIQHLVVTIIYEESSTNTNGDHGHVSNNKGDKKKKKKIQL